MNDIILRVIDCIREDLEWDDTHDLEELLSHIPVYILEEYLSAYEEDRYCPYCGRRDVVWVNTLTTLNGLFSNSNFMGVS
jgi:hypothetical protein